MSPRRRPRTAASHRPRPLARPPRVIGEYVLFCLSRGDDWATASPPHARPSSGHSPAMSTQQCLMDQGSVFWSRKGMQESTPIGRGAYLCDEENVRLLCTEGSERVIISMGVSFDHGEDRNLHLAMEGGHSHNRIDHSSDITGRD